jgi:hypothetical protein
MQDAARMAQVHDGVKGQGYPEAAAGGPRIGNRVQ